MKTQVILPEKKYTCPDCGNTVTIGQDCIVVECNRCGIPIFRPLSKE